MADDKIAAANKDQNLTSQPSWLPRVAVLTGVLAALAGFLTVRSTNLSNEAIYHSNQGVLHQAKASDLWAEYQANSVKAHVLTSLVESQAAKPETVPALTSRAKAYLDRKPELMKQAHDEEAQCAARLKLGETRLGEKDILGYAGMAATVGHRPGIGGGADPPTGGIFAGRGHWVGGLRHHRLRIYGAFPSGVAAVTDPAKPTAVPWAAPFPRQRRGLFGSALIASHPRRYHRKIAYKPPTFSPLGVVA